MFCKYLRLLLILKQKYGKIYKPDRRSEREKGMQKGIMLGVTNNIKQLMVNLKMTAEQAMNALGIPKQEQAEYMRLIGQK